MDTGHMKHKGEQINESSQFSSHRYSQQPRVYVSRKNTVHIIKCGSARWLMCFNVCRYLNESSHYTRYVCVSSIFDLILLIALQVIKWYRLVATYER
jgi:hypothetical protein